MMNIEVTAMRRPIILVSFLLVAVVASPGCDSNASNFAAPTDTTFDLADLAEVLFATGVPVDVGNEEVLSFFPVPVRHFTVFDDDVLVLEFVGPNTTAAVASTISSDGNAINGQAIDWPAPPHFFQEGRIIVLYLGDDSQVISALAQILGPQFAGG